MITDPHKHKGYVVGIGLATLLFLAWMPGCAKVLHTTGGGKGESVSPIITVREFPDVPMPKELNLDEKESFLYMAPGLATGLLVYDGNVDYDSLLRFFNESLTKHGWVIRASLKYPRTMLFYQKANRVCLITMKTMTLNVHVEIWVAPVDTFSY
jgi:hypothetical protein